MANVLDVASYILSQKGKMTAMKLQKLAYYSQAWSLVWDEAPLFNDKIEAWVNGPVAPTLYHAHKGHFIIGKVQGGDARRLNKIQKETIGIILEHYGDKSSQWLSDLTHAEEPWQNARKGLSPRTRGNREITKAAMAEYYGSL